MSGLDAVEDGDIGGACAGAASRILSGVLPLSFVILSSRSCPDALSLASRFSRRMRACRCCGVSGSSLIMVELTALWIYLSGF